MCFFPITYVQFVAYFGLIYHWHRKNHRYHFNQINVNMNVKAETNGNLVLEVFDSGLEMI